MEEWMVQGVVSIIDQRDTGYENKTELCTVYTTVYSTVYSKQYRTMYSVQYTVQNYVHQYSVPVDPVSSV